MALTPFASPITISSLPSATLQKFPEAVSVLSQKDADYFQSISSMTYDAVFVLNGRTATVQRTLVLRLNTRTCNPQYLICETKADQSCACTLISRAKFYKLFLTLVSCGLERQDHCECRPTPVCCGTSRQGIDSSGSEIPCSCSACQNGKIFLDLP